MFRKHEVRKSRYQVLYLGWKECLGIHGRQFTDPILWELITERDRGPGNLITLALQISGKSLKMTGELEKPTPSGAIRIERVKYPSIPATDIAYATVADRPHSSVVMVIILGYNPSTNCPAHAHGFQCDSTETARQIVDHLQQILEMPDQRRRLEVIELDLIGKGLIRPSGLLNASATSLSVQPDQQDPPPPVGRKRSPSILYNDQHLAVYNLTTELKQKLTTSSSDRSPVIHPPKDYDTWSRAELATSLDDGAAVDPFHALLDGAVPMSEAAMNQIPEIPPADYEDEVEERRAHSSHQHHLHHKVSDFPPSYFLPVYSPGRNKMAAVGARTSFSTSSCSSSDSSYQSQLQQQHHYGADDQAQYHQLQAAPTAGAVHLRDRHTRPAADVFAGLHRSTPDAAAILRNQLSPVHCGRGRSRREASPAGYQRNSDSGIR